ncbi:MAG: molybdenum cofactor guanylyltransferase [Jatrophihabitantaceae bacterium]
MFDAIVLAGGRARRLGGADKPAVEIDGMILLDRAIRAAETAQRIVVVGPRRTTRTAVVWTREDPPGGGPVAAIAAGLPHVEQAWCLVLAADLPAIAPAVPQLLTAANGADVALLTRDGARHHLAAVWRTDALREAIEALPTADGAAVRDLLAGRDVAEVPDAGDWGLDCNTWGDIEHARGEHG